MRNIIKNIKIRALINENIIEVHLHSSNGSMSIILPNTLTITSTLTITHTLTIGLSGHHCGPILSTFHLTTIKAGV